MRTLYLTSPRMHGDDVKYAQRLLRDNKYGKYYSGEIDGVFGELSAQAVHRAKYWLGYPKEHINKAIGDKLRGYLSGAKPLPYEFRLRRAVRLKRAAATPMREKALTRAISQIGYHEGAANWTKYGSWYGMQGPWCAVFVSWCYAGAGSNVFKPGVRYAYVPYILADARAGRNSLTITYSPKPGDLVLFNWDGGNPDHVGLFEKWLSTSEFSAIEGNVSDQVARKRRSKVGTIFVHVGG